MWVIRITYNKSVKYLKGIHIKKGKYGNEHIEVNTILNKENALAYEDINFLYHIVELLKFVYIPAVEIVIVNRD